MVTPPGRVSIPMKGSVSARSLSQYHIGDVVVTELTAFHVLNNLLCLGALLGHIGILSLELAARISCAPRVECSLEGIAFPAE